METRVNHTTFTFPQNIVGIIVSSIDGIPLGVVSKNIIYGETRHMFVPDAKNITTVKRLSSSIKYISITQKDGPNDPKQCEFSIGDNSHTSWDPNFTTETYDKPISITCIAGRPQFKNVRITYVKKGSIVTDIHFRLLKVDYKCDVDYSQYADVIMVIVLIIFIAMIVARSHVQNKISAAKKAMDKAEQDVAYAEKKSIADASNFIEML
jgi:hypothetical protein